MVEILIAPHESKQLVVSDHSVDAYRCTVGQGGNLSLVLGIFQPQQITIKLILEGANASASAYCLVGINAGETKIHVTQHHKVADTKSAVLVKGLLHGTAQLKSSGQVVIDSRAAGSTASQYHKVLLLSPTAHAIATPCFAVSNHHVRCNHGAAIGKLDATQMYYLQSRGIDVQTAQRLLVEGFAQEIIAQAGEFGPQWKEKIVGSHV